jgi:hypothetical protein
MTRRKIIIGASITFAALGVAALAGIADHFAILRADEDDDDDDDGGREAVVRGIRFAKVSLQQGMSASEREGQPISAKFEVDRGNFQPFGLYVQGGQLLGSAGGLFDRRGHKGRANHRGRRSCRCTIAKCRDGECEGSLERYRRKDTG